MNNQFRTWLLQKLKLEWNPKPISAPQPDENLAHLNGTQRMVESIRFFLLTTEHWISADGILREWLRMMLKLFILVTCPIVIFMPTVAFALWQVALWTTFLLVITKTFILLPIGALVAITLVGILVIVVRSIFAPR